MKFIDDVGEIFISENDEWVWMVPEVLVFDNKCCLTSAWFSFAEETWRLVIMPSDGEGHCEEESGYMSLFLWKKNMRPPRHVYSVELGVKANDGTTYKSEFGETFSYYGFEMWDILKIDDDTPESCFSCGLMAIFCSIKKKKDIPNGRSVSTQGTVHKSGVVAAEQDVKVEAKGVERLAQDFRSLLNEEWSSDVILKTDDREFHVHRMVLWARSRVFASMFEHDMAEKTSGVVDIPDCTGEAFEVFLQYLYTGSAAISPDNMLNLYYTADKYRVDDLKAECVEYMKRNLSLDNICGVISLSLWHKDSSLLDTARHFFCRNVKQIIFTVQWQKFLTDNPIHANELYIKAINA